MTAKINNPHSWFFAYVRSLPSYSPAAEQIVRESIVSAYSNGSTSSLKELYEHYPVQYARMRKALRMSPTKGNMSETGTLNLWRKRLLAVLFSYLANGSCLSPTMQLVKSVAANAAEVEEFNHIPLAKLKELYHVFVAKNKKKKP